MSRISWGRKMGFAWGMVAGMAMGASAYGPPWIAILAILPFAGMLMCSGNDTARNGGVSYTFDD